MSTAALLILLLILLALAVVAILYLEASGRFLPKHPPVTPIRVETPAEGLVGMEAYLREEFHTRPAERLKSGATRRDLLHDKRDFFDEVGSSRDYPAEFREGVARFNGTEVPGEWTLVDGADPNIRLLYLHGGGFTVGSARSHRALTVNLAKRLGGVVFAPDYRLMPENPRLASVEDSRAAYGWLAENGPDGTAPARRLYVSGDSAGGSLTLMVLQWARDEGVRAADGAVVFSPSTDYSMTGPNLAKNFQTDTMLQPLAKPIMDAPKLLLPLGLWKAMGARPSDARVSPLFGDLSNLPPTLIQVSETELLYDDAVRYAGRAEAMGSPVTLEIWHGAPVKAPLPHVWVMFDRELPAAVKALDRAGDYLNGLAT